jgi:tetratricopeptide (TPR) repeat protein/curved DNA-binding protein CbpA
MKTPYDVLGVRRYADDATIRAALRKAAKAYHPDVNADNPAAVQHLREVITAYETLRNPQQRAAYDQLLRRRRREKARRLTTTAVASAGLVSACTLALTVWLSQTEPASERAPEQSVAAVLANEPAGQDVAAAGPASGPRVEPDGAGVEATAKVSPPPVAVAGMVIRPANGALTEDDSGPRQDQDKAQADDGPDVVAGQPLPELASAEENVGSAATDLGAGPPPLPEDGKFTPEPSATPQALLAEEWKGLQESRDLLAVWAFAARNPDAPEASLARSRLTELIEGAEDAAALSALHAAATGAIAETAQRRLAHLNAPRAAQQVTAAAASEDAAPSSDPAFYVARGLRWSQKGDLDRAIADFDRAIELAPGNAPAHSHRASAWGAKGDKDRALADFEAAIRLDPGSPIPFRDRGTLWRRSGALDLALVDLDQAIRLGFSDAGAYNERGLVWQAKGRNERAIADFDRAIKIDPTLAAAYANRGIALRGKGDLDRAIADFDAAIRIDPGIAAAYYHRGHARSEQQDFERASADYARARELMPNAHIR